MYGKLKEKIMRQTRRVTKLSTWGIIFIYYQNKFSVRWRKEAKFCLPLPQALGCGCKALRICSLGRARAIWGVRQGNQSNIFGEKGVGERNIYSYIFSRKRNVQEKSGSNLGCKRKSQFIEPAWIEIVKNKEVISRLFILKSTQAEDIVGRNWGEVDLSEP